MAIERTEPVAAGVIPPSLALGIEVEEVPDAVSIPTEDGGAIVDFAPETDNENIAFDANLAEHIDASELLTLASDLKAEFEADQESRMDWVRTYIEGLDLLGLKFEERSEPWAGACGVFHPLLAEAVVRFQSQTIQEIFPASGPVRTEVVGDLSPAKMAQSVRVETYLNYVATKKMKEYRTETEKLLFSLPLAGSAFRKVYQDHTLDRPAAMFCPAEDVCVSYGTTDLTTCERITHIMKKTPNQVRKLQVKGFYLDIELSEPSPDLSEIQKKYDEMKGESENYAFDGRHTLLEMQVDLDLDGFEDELNGEQTGIALPYVVTLDSQAMEILAIRRNWEEGDSDHNKSEFFVHYQYLPGLGFYGFGLTHMIGGLSRSATSILRQLVDAGTLANLPGGLKTRGLRIKGDDSPIMPGEFRDVDVPSGAIRDNLAFLPYKEPSGVLYQLLQDLVNEGRRFASAADLKTSDMNAEAPVGTTLAILEREMKVLSAIQARIHHAMGVEVAMLAEVVRDYGPDEYPYEIEGEFTVKEDFDDRVDIIPVSDPNAGTMAQRIMQYQAALQLAAQAPQMYDMPLLHRQMLEVLGIRDADKIVPTEDDLKPTDPVTETMALLNGEPVKAFMYQDHEAHLQVHMAAAKNPQLMEMMAQHPNAQQVAAAGAAHVSEHLAFAYRAKIEQELGVELPSPEQPLPEDIELRISRLVAPAAAQLTGKAEQQKQAEENAKKQEDPIIQMAEKELAIKEQTAKDRAKESMAKIQADLEKHDDKTQLERDRLTQQGQIETAKLVAKVQSDENRSEDQADAVESREQIEGFKMGLNMIKDLVINRQKDNGGK